MISEQVFADEEVRIGKQVHHHNGIWWSKIAPFYYKPVHEFRPFEPGSSRPHPMKALLGYSHQVSTDEHANRHLSWNIIQGEDLTSFSMDRLKPAKRRAVRRGLKDCNVLPLDPSEYNLEQMRLMNISQARRFEGVRKEGTFKTSDYYSHKASTWRSEIKKLFGHKGHQFWGAFFDDILIAYIDLVKIEDTWMFSAVKSHTEHHNHRPVDVLYYTILSDASQNESCARVINGGPSGSPESLIYFKEQFFLRSTSLPYFTNTMFPLHKLKNAYNRLFCYIFRNKMKDRSISQEA